MPQRRGRVGKGEGGVRVFLKGGDIFSPLPLRDTKCPLSKLHIKNAVCERGLVRLRLAEMSLTLDFRVPTVSLRH